MKPPGPVARPGHITTHAWPGTQPHNAEPGQRLDPPARRCQQCSPLRTDQSIMGELEQDVVGPSPSSASCHDLETAVGRSTPPPGSCHPPGAWDQVEGFSAMSMGP